MSTPQHPPPPDDSWSVPPAGRAGWQQPGGYSAPPGPPRSNGVAIAALVCGIVALLTSWIPFINFLSVALAIAAIVTGAIGLRNAAERGGRGLAITGLVTGIAALVVAIAILVFVVNVFQDVANDPEVQEQLQRELERLQSEGAFDTDGG